MKDWVNKSSRKNKMKNATNIIVKDYPLEGSYIFGTFHEQRKNKDGNMEVFYILDDGDVYSEEQLRQNDFPYVLIHSNQIIEIFKKRFEEVIK